MKIKLYKSENVALPTYVIEIDDIEMIKLVRKILRETRSIKYE